MTADRIKQVYFSLSQIGVCNICKIEDDLRFGACYDCSDQVDGEKVSGSMYRLWDRRNPSNEWFVRPGWKNTVE